MNTQKEIYKRLIRVIPNLYSIKEYGKSEAPGFMDFNLDILQRKGDVLRIAIMVKSIAMTKRTAGKIPIAVTPQMCAPTNQD